MFAALLVALAAAAYANAQTSNPPCGVQEQLPESAIGNLICLVEPARSDFDRNNMQMQRWRERYSVSFAQSESNFVKQHFTVAPNGSLYVAAPIDREELCTSAQLCCASELLCDIPLRLRLAGAGKLAMFTTVVSVIDINDNPPRFEHTNYEVEISEAVPIGYVIVLPQATDGDSRKYNIERYDWRWKSKMMRPFELRMSKLNSTSRSGSGSVEAYIVTTSRLDRERSPVYDFILFAIDTGSQHTGSTEIHVVVTDVNDNAPQFARAVYSGTIAENAFPTTTILQLSATDADDALNGQIEYSLKGDATATEKFAIDQYTGVITLADSLDFERQREYRFTVLAIDQSPTNAMTGQTDVIINVTNVNDEAPRIVLELLSDQHDKESLDLSEATPVGTLVGLVQVVDDDSTTVNCALLGTSKFRLVRTLPNATEFRIVTMATFDREGSSLELVTVHCADQGDRLQLTTSAAIRVNIVDENDCSPEFIFSLDAHPAFRDGVLQLHVTENNNAGDLIFDLRAVDRDEHRNGQLTYTLSAEGSECCRLEQDGRLVARRPFDRETQSEYRVRATVCDGGSPPHCAFAHVHITVVDINDNAPTWQLNSLTLNVSEASPNGTRIATFDVRDNDLAENGEVELSGPFPISAADYSDVRGTFRLANRSLLLVKPLDRETIQTYYFVLTATDQGPRRLASTATVTLYVGDANDHAPTVDLRAVRNNTVRVPYGEQPGTIICEMTVYDLDAGDNGKVLVHIEEGNELGLFDIKSFARHELRRRVEHVAVTVAKSLPQIFVGNHTLRLVVTDCGSPPRSTTVTLTIVVENSEARSKQRVVPTDDSTSRNAIEAAWTKPLLLICFISITAVLLIGVISFVYFRFIYKSNPDRPPAPDVSKAPRSRQSKAPEETLYPYNGVPVCTGLWNSNRCVNECRKAKRAEETLRPVLRPDDQCDSVHSTGHRSPLPGPNCDLSTDDCSTEHANSLAPLSRKTRAPAPRDDQDRKLASMLSCAHEDGVQGSDDGRLQGPSEEPTTTAARLFLTPQSRRSAAPSPSHGRSKGGMTVYEYEEQQVRLVGAECDFQPRSTGSSENLAMHLCSLAHAQDQNQSDSGRNSVGPSASGQAVLTNRFATMVTSRKGTATATKNANYKEPYVSPFVKPSSFV